MEIEAYRAALAAILPDGLVVAVDEIGEAEATAHPGEAAVVSEAAAHRRNEFLAGRRLARAALQVAAPILPDTDGVPQWPEGRIASISHSRGLCCAVAGEARALRCLGIDLEKTNRLSPAAAKRVVHPLELAFVGEDQLRASLLFCLKEAFYKAQYARWRTPANFHDLALDVDLGRGIACVAELADRFAPELQAASTDLQFRFEFCGDYVAAVCWLRS